MRQKMPVENENHFYEIVKRNLRKYRIMSGHSQETIAELIGCVRSNYTYTESGKVKPSLYVLAILANLYRISIDDFMKLSEENETIRRRPKRSYKKHNDPSKIGELSIPERKLIARHRHVTWEEWLSASFENEIAQQLDEIKR